MLSYFYDQNDSPLRSDIVTKCLDILQNDYGLSSICQCAFIQHWVPRVFPLSNHIVTTKPPSWSSMPRYLGTWLIWEESKDFIPTGMSDLVPSMVTTVLLRSTSGGREIFGIEIVIGGMFGGWKVKFIFGGGIEARSGALSPLISPALDFVIGANSALHNGMRWR